MAAQRFEVVQDETDPPQTPPSESNFNIGALLFALKALSQRTLIAIDNLFTLLTVASAFWLWMSIKDPNPYQLVGLAMYAIFVLAANWIVRRK